MDGLANQLPPLPSKAAGRSDSPRSMLGELEAQINAAADTIRGVDGNRNSKIILILDQADLLLAISSDHITAADLSKMFLRLRQVCTPNPAEVKLCCSMG